MDPHGTTYVATRVSTLALALDAGITRPFLVSILFTPFSITPTVIPSVMVGLDTTVPTVAYVLQQKMLKWVYDNIPYGTKIVIW